MLDLVRAGRLLLYRAGEEVGEGLDARLVHAATGVPMDVSFDIDSGLRTGRLINELLRAMPPLRPLILVLKHFLLQRRLNETFTGGIGSFMLQLMVVSFLQMRHRTDCATGVRCAPNGRCW